MCRNPQRKVTDKHGTFNIEMASDDEFLARWKNEVQQNNVVIAVINVITLQLGLGNWVGHELASGPDHRTGGTKKMAARLTVMNISQSAISPGAPAYGQQVINLCVFSAGFRSERDYHYENHCSIFSGILNHQPKTTDWLLVGLVRQKKTRLANHIPSSSIPTDYQYVSSCCPFKLCRSCMFEQI